MERKGFRRVLAQVVIVCRVCGKPGFKRVMKDRAHKDCAAIAKAEGN